MRAIYILCLRQLKRYVRSPARIVGSLGQPVVFLLALGFGLGAIFKRAGAGNYINFVTPGIIAMGIMFTAVFSGIEIIWDPQFGFFKGTLVAPGSGLQIVLGGVLGRALAGMPSPSRVASAIDCNRPLPRFWSAATYIGHGRPIFRHGPG